MKIDIEKTETTQHSFKLTENVILKLLTNSGIVPKDTALNLIFYNKKENKTTEVNSENYIELLYSHKSIKIKSFFNEE